MLIERAGILRGEKDYDRYINHKSVNFSELKVKTKFIPMHCNT